VNSERVGARDGWILLAVLGALVAVDVPQLGSDPWPFKPPFVHAHGLFGALVRAGHERWDLGLIRTPGMLAGLLVAAVAVAAWRLPPWPRGAAVALCTAVVALLLVPAVLLQVGLRDATAPWFHTNDSTYQIELAGDLVLHGHDPYGHNYDGSGLERFYTRDGSLPPPSAHRQVALHHFAYFPGTTLTAAAWRVLPAPLDDYRLFVLLATLATLFAALLFRAPLVWKLAAGATLAANPIAVRAAWFGTADAPSLLCVVLAFAFASRRKPVAAAAAIAAAVLLKQFALAAVPFLALLLVMQSTPRPALKRAAATFGLILLAGFLPFLVAGPGALWHDTITYGTGTYRIVGYGLSSLLLRAGIPNDRYGFYPFTILAVLVWLPVTVWLLVNQRRSGRAWTAAAGFAVSIFVLVFIARVFQTSYLAWPLTGGVLAVLLAAPEKPVSRP
jgi:Glycosyltransferase family 87